MNSNCAKVMRIDEENNKTETTDYPCQQLPDEIIFHIMSYLPLSSLFKFRSVCKLWNTLFMHPHLAFIHYRHSYYDRLDFDDVTDDKKEMEREERDGEYFTTIAKSSHGLLLEQTTSIDGSPSTNLKYRIECPLLRQRLAIPKPQNPSLCISLDFVHSKYAVKLVSVYEDDENQYSLGYETLTLGIGIDQTTYCWRAVKVPSPNLQHNSGRNGNRKRIQLFFRMDVAYCIWYVETEDDNLKIEVDVLDMANESYIGHTTFPRDFFSKLSLSSTNLVDWNGRLSFAELVKDELHILVLHDYRKLKWDESKRIIKLTFLKPYNKEQITFFTFADNSILFFVRQDKKSFCSYDITKGKLITCVMSSCINSPDEVTDVIAHMMFYREATRNNWVGGFN